MSNALAKSVYVTSTWPPESELWNSATSALQMCTASLYRSTDCPPLIIVTAVMLHGHAMLISCQFVGGGPLVCVRMW